MEVVRAVDWAIDLGPEGGDGEIVDWDPPQDIVNATRRYIGKYLVLAKAGKPKKRKVDEAAERGPS